MRVTKHVYDGIETDPSYEWHPDETVDIALLVEAINRVVASKPGQAFHDHVAANHEVTTVHHTTPRKASEHADHELPAV